MKTKAIMGLLVACFLGASSVFMFARNDTPVQDEQQPTATVKICPKSGLPCDGGGDCGHDHGGSACTNGCCAAEAPQAK